MPKGSRNAGYTGASRKSTGVPSRLAVGRSSATGKAPVKTTTKLKKGI